MIRSPQLRESPETTNAQEGGAFGASAARATWPVAKKKSTKTENTAATRLMNFRILLDKTTDGPNPRYARGAHRARPADAAVRLRLRELIASSFVSKKESHGP